MATAPSVERDLSFKLIDTAEQFTSAVAGWARQPRLWIDIEVADYFSKDARVAALQVRDTAGEIIVVDCLAASLHAVLHGEFVPRVMENASVEKWAHNAPYERRFLGGARVENLRCTLALSRSLPYYRLPTRAWSLAALVYYFWGLNIDKSYQAQAWGRRPLPHAAWSYAAWDTEWCHRIWMKVSELAASHTVPSSPEQIAKRFAEFDHDHKIAKERRETIWDTIREFMLAEKLTRFGGFEVTQRDSAMIELSTLARCLTAADPHSLVTCPISLTRRHQEALGGASDPVKHASEVVGGTGFKVPTERHRRTFVYALDRDNPERAEQDFAEAYHEHKRWDSERDELKDAIKAIMLEEGRDELVGFRMTDRSANWRIDPRALVLLAPGVDLGSFNFSAKVKAVLDSASIPHPEEGVETSLRWVMRRPPPRVELAHEVEQERFE